MIGFEPVAHDLEVHQQCIRSDVVGAQRLAVELGRIVLRHVEVTVVQQQVAVDRVNARLSHESQHLPDPLGDEERIPVTADQQVAGQAAILDLAEREDLGRPPVVRAQRVEADERRQQLHRRCRIARHVVLPAQDHFPAVHVLHVNAQGIVRNLADIEDMTNRLRQFVLLRECD